MAKVIVSKADYNYANLKPIFFSMMDILTGDQIKPGSRVLIKPNMLSVAEPKDAILTHPLIIKAAVDYVLQKGAHPQVSDSPAIGSFARILKSNGTAEALAGLDVVCLPFEDTLATDMASLTAKLILQPTL